MGRPLSNAGWEGAAGRIERNPLGLILGAVAGGWVLRKVLG